jgi:hypothetical protein
MAIEAFWSAQEKSSVDFVDGFTLRLGLAKSLPGKTLLLELDKV